MVRHPGGESSFFVERHAFFAYPGPRTAWVPFSRPLLSWCSRLTGLSSPPSLSLCQRDDFVTNRLKKKITTLKSG
jgi:hypothetical protein